MKNKKLIVIFGVLVLSVLFIFVGGDAYFYFTDSGDGKAYKSKQALCMDFAQSYLRTIPKTEKDFNNDKWSLAIVVETRLYNLCQVELTEEALERVGL